MIQLTQAVVAPEGNHPEGAEVYEIPTTQRVVCPDFTFFEASCLFAALEKSRRWERFVGEFPVVSPTDEDSWVAQMSERMVSLLADLADEDVEVTAKHLSRLTKKEVEWTLNASEELIQSLRPLSKAAISKGEKVYLWQTTNLDVYTENGANKAE